LEITDKTTYFDKNTNLCISWIRWFHWGSLELWLNLMLTMASYFV